MSYGSLASGLFDILNLYVRFKDQIQLKCAVAVGCAIQVDVEISNNLYFVNLSSAVDRGRWRQDRRDNNCVG